MLNNNNYNKYKPINKLKNKYFKLYDILLKKLSSCDCKINLNNNLNYFIEKSTAKMNYLLFKIKQKFINLNKKIDNEIVIKDYDKKSEISVLYLTSVIKDLELKIIADSINNFNIKPRGVTINFDKSLFINPNYSQIDVTKGTFDCLLKKRENNLLDRNIKSFKSKNKYYYYNNNYKYKIKYKDYDSYKVSNNFCHNCKAVLESKYLFKCSNGVNNKSNCFGFDEQCKMFMGFKSNRFHCNKEYCVGCLKNSYGYNLKSINFKKFICPFCINKCFCSRCDNRDMIIKISNILLKIKDNSLNNFYIDGSPIENIMTKILNKHNKSELEDSGYSATEFNYNYDNYINQLDSKKLNNKEKEYLKLLLLKKLKIYN